MRRILVLVALLGLAAMAGGQWLERTFTIPDTMGEISSPRKVEFNPLTRRVYVATSSNTIVFDGLTAEKVRVFRGRYIPHYLRGTGKLYLVGNPTLIIDAYADTVLRQLILHGAVGPAAYSPTSGKLYVALSGPGVWVAVIDAASERVVKVIGGWAEVAALDWDSEANRMWVLDRGRHTVNGIDCAGDTVDARLQLSRAQDLLAVATRARKVYCAGDDDWTDVVSADLPRRRWSIWTGSVDTMLYSPAANRLALACYGTLLLLDCADDAVRAAIAGDRFTGMAACSTGNRLYCGGADEVLVIADDQLADSINVESWGYGYADELGFSAECGGVWCALSRDYAVKIDVPADSVAAVADYAAYYIRAMAYNPVNGLLYCLSTGSDDVAAVTTEGQVVVTLATGLSSYSEVVLDTARNRLYISDAGWLRIVDCSRNVIPDSVAIKGTSRARLVYHAGTDRLFVFPWRATGSPTIWAFDCATDSISDSIYVGQETPCAAYHPSTDRIYFVKEGATRIQELNPHTDTVSEVAAGVSVGSTAWMSAGSGLSLYLLSYSPRLLYLVDLAADSAVYRVPTPTSLDTMYWSPTSRKLYLSNENDDGPTYVVSVDARQITDTLDAGPRRNGLMNTDRDRLWLGGNRELLVVSCGSDSIVARPTCEWSQTRAVAWDRAGNRVFFAYGNEVSVYADSMAGVDDRLTFSERVGLWLVANPASGVARFRCIVPAAERAQLVVRDVLGRQVAVMEVPRGEGQVSVTWQGTDAGGQKVASGIYFAQLVAGGQTATVKVILN